MKITKRQLRRIIKEAAISPEQGIQMQVDQDLPHLLAAITTAVYDGLEELGFDEAQSKAMAERLLTGALATAAHAGVDNYIGKLRISGGRPKPRSV